MKLPVSVLMPQSGNLLKWHRAAGDLVRVGDLLCDIETDKTVLTIESETEGLLARIEVEAGTSQIAEGRPLARIEAPLAQPAESSRDEVRSSQEQLTVSSPVLGIDGKGRLAASPRARRLASEAGVPLRSITGTGPNGRILERDVLRARDGALPDKSGPAAPVADSPNDAADSVLVPLDNMRRAIAARLTLSKQTVPHFYLSADINMDALLELRERINQDVAAESRKLKLTVNDFIVKALAAALVAVPEANAVWEEGGIRRFKHADVGIAVAVEGGLYTPVVRRAQTLSLGDLSREIASLVARARTRSLQPHEYQGGAASVSNLGMFGVERFSAIINPPQSSILAVGAAQPRVVARGNEAVIASVMSATLSCDHRVIDGAVGARLLRQVRQLLEAPGSLLF